MPEEAITMKEIVRRLRIAVAISELSEYELAVRASMHSCDIKRILDGEKKPSSLEIALISDASGVPLEAIIPIDLLRDVLEALCEKDGISLDSEWGGPARNFELIERLGIGHILTMKEGK